MSYDHDYPSDDAHEATYAMPNGQVSVSKVGGGTVGRTYSGSWHYLVSDLSGEVIARGSDYQSYFPSSHQGVALVIAQEFYPVVWDTEHSPFGEDGEVKRA